MKSIKSEEKADMGNRITVKFENIILLENSILNFGKYKGEFAGFVAMTDPSYLGFLKDKLAYHFSPELDRIYKEQMNGIYLFNRNELVKEAAEKALDELTMERLELFYFCGLDNLVD